VNRREAAQWLAAAALHIAQRWGAPGLVRCLCRLSAAQLALAGGR
jgi:hypothetical protein